MLLYFTLEMCEMCFFLGLTEIKSGWEQDVSKCYPPLFTRGCWCAKIDPAKRKCFSEESGPECDFYREIPDCHCCLRSDMLVVLTTLSSLKLLRLALQDNYINIREEVSDNSREGSYHFALSGKSFQVISQHFSSLLPKVSSKRVPVS